MAYSTNPETLRAWLPHLGELIEGRTCKWKLKEPRAAWFAYKTREALAIARLMQTNEVYSGTDSDFILAAYNLSLMAEKVRVTVSAPDEVQAVLAAQPPEAEVLAGVTPTQGLEPAGILPSQDLGTQTAQSIQEEWEARQPSNDPLHFPRANLELSEMLKLHSWATSMHLLILEADGAITLRRKERGLEEFAWTPQDAGVAP